MIQCQLLWRGEVSSLGSVSFPSGKIQAMGPEPSPPGTGVFGIRELATHAEQWASPRAQPEVWFRTEVEVQEKQLNLDLSFRGLTPENPLLFSFYVEAPEALVGRVKIEPGGFNRYAGFPQVVQFGQELQFEGWGASRLEVIPVDPSAFWNAQYLIAYTVNSKFLFQATVLAK